MNWNNQIITNKEHEQNPQPGDYWHGGGEILKADCFGFSDRRCVYCLANLPLAAIRRKSAWPHKLARNRRSRI